MKKITIIMLAMALLPAMNAFSQSKDKAMFKEYEPGFYQNFILKDVHAIQQKQHPKKMEKKFQMDQSGMKLPNKIAGYKDHTYWHTPTTSQGNTGTC